LISGSIVLPDELRGDDVEHAARQPDLLEDLASLSIDSGVCLAGLTTIVQPAAIAGRSCACPSPAGSSTA
jgi:hypothetical protein